jgi:hypothetical protein
VTSSRSEVGLVPRVALVAVAGGVAALDIGNVEVILENPADEQRDRTVVGGALVAIARHLDPPVLARDLQRRSRPSLLELRLAVGDETADQARCDVAQGDQHADLLVAARDQAGVIEQLDVRSADIDREADPERRLTAHRLVHLDLGEIGGELIVDLLVDQDLVANVAL